MDCPSRKSVCRTACSLPRPSGQAAGSKCSKYFLWRAMDDSPPLAGRSTAHVISSAHPDAPLPQGAVHILEAAYAAVKDSGENAKVVLHALSAPPSPQRDEPPPPLTEAPTSGPLTRAPTAPILQRPQTQERRRSAPTAGHAATTATSTPATRRPSASRGALSERSGSRNYAI
eukprot:6483777-Prymnesium_polylepis.1